MEKNAEELNTTKARNSNFELLRIIMMLYIVTFHTILHGHVIGYLEGTHEFFVTFLISFLIIAVNVFVILSGYFQCKNKLKFSKVIALNNSVWFYSLTILVIATLFKIYTPTKLEIAKAILPISFNDYWFMTMYFVLYLISPMINKIILNTTRKQLKQYIILLFVINSILGIFTRGEFFNVELGYSLYNFIMLYMIGAYLRLYPIRDSYHFKQMSKNKVQVIFITLYILSSISNFVFNYFGRAISGVNEIVSWFGSVFFIQHTAYNNPFVIIGAVSIFIFFEGLNINNKKINKIAASSFGVYLIHDNPIVRENLYKRIGLVRGGGYTTKTFLYVFFCAIIIYSVCTVIEIIRKYIFKKIYDTELAKSNRKKYRKFVDSLGYEINW